MNKQKNRRSAIKGRITTAAKMLDAHEIIPLTLIEATNLQKRIDKLVEENSEIFEKIVDLCATEADLPPHEILFEEEDCRLQIMKNLVMEILEEFAPTPSTASASATTTSTTPSSSSDIRLPRLELPTFSGNRLDWLSFHDLFRAAVHNNNQLSGAQKLQYLKTAVKGEAASLIQAFPLTDDNYSEAWKTLETRYQDTRELINQIFESLLSIPNLQTENPVVLQKIFDRAKECIRAVEVLSVPKDKAYELIIIHLLSKKLDSESRLQWERVLKKDTLPSFQEFCEFGDHQARVTGAARLSIPPKSRPDNRKTGTSVHHGTIKPPSSHKASCNFCTDDHHIFQCRKFKSLTLDEKWKFVKSKNLCFNCLSSSHRSDKCKSSHCRHCEKFHHSLLHGGETTPKPPAPAPQPPQQPPPPEPPIASHFATNSRTKGLLSTALIKVKDNCGEFQICRALLDNGSESSFVTSSCATRLGLRRQKVQVPLSGLAGADAGTSREMVELNFSSCYGFEPTFKIHGLILKNVTSDLPSTTLKKKTDWTHLHGLELADPHFQDVSKIDVLLGADIFYNLMQVGKIEGMPGEPIAIKTALGWILGGTLSSSRPGEAVSTYMVQCHLDSTLRKFWELEEIPRQKFLTAEEKACEEHYATTHSRDDTGRFIVRLPMKESCSTLGASRDMAIRRFKSGERKNIADPIRMKTYRDVMKEYLQLGHMELVPDNAQPSSTYYMPHHAVENLASSTTPFRVVFDASAATSSGTSLNQNLLVGPKLQEDLVSILIRFRKNKIAFTADIPKMYRQILVHREDIDLQRIVWRDNPQEPIRDYRLLTATFGTSAAPYLAIKSVQQLAEYEKEHFPAAAAIVKQDFYVDDLMSGANSEEEAALLQVELMTLLERGGMSLRKWSSNSSALMSTIPDHLREKTTPLNIEEDASVKTLGLQWNPAGDYFSFRVTLAAISPTTKRTILSEIAKLFDPLGWLSPVTITAKIFMQQMWKEDLGWDEELPLRLQDEWLQYRGQMAIIQDLQIPRFVSQDKPVLQQIHGFCDASEAAYAAVVFLRTINAGGDVMVQMVAAKSKVAPTKQVSLPRLELCGAVLLTRLLLYVKEALKISVDGIFGWTDSTIVLAWLASPPHRWKTFVANRVSEIQDFLPRESWQHVKSEENPADCASRGIPQSELLGQKLWWRGPGWLSETTIPSSASSENVDVDAPEERAVAAVLHSTEEDSLLYRYSDLSKLLRITSYCLRAVDWMRRKRPILTRQRKQLMPSPVTAAEMDRALMAWIKVTQHSEFQKDIFCLKRKDEVPAGSRLLRLSPFMDKEGILRVGGRLQKSEVNPEGKHPIVLPKKHYLTQLIIANQHGKDLHTGPQALLSSLMQKYWILAGRDVVRHFVRKCVKCVRFRAQSLQQKMGELPAARVTPAFTFLKTGVDYAGPYSLTAKKGRGQRSSKSYSALFVCMVSRAIHLELVSDLSTEAFIAALRRFIARRGKPSDIYSDCGTNFVGAKRKLEEYVKLLSSTRHNNRLQEELAQESINWHMNPPAGAHHGGLWEAGVKSMKHHLHRVIGVATLTTEEMRTLLAQVEACLNSRPITELSSDPADLLPLTPGHFLIGRPLTALADPKLTHLKESHLSRWQRVQQMFQHFWKRWSSEYLSRLQQRNKWLTGQENVKIGTIVLIKDDNLPPAKWNLGRISATFPGDDSRVRVVNVKTATSELKRPITKLCLLPIT